MAQTQHYVRHHPYVDVIGGYLWIAEDANGELYFPVRPTCEALEIGSQTALERIRNDGRLQPGLCAIKLPTAGGEQEQQCLASTEYAWWLALIDPRRFKPDRRELLTERQRVLMSLAKEIMLKRGAIQQIRADMHRDHGRAIAPRGAGIEAPFRCLRCGAPHVAVIDGAGWHLHLGVESEV